MKKLFLAIGVLWTAGLGLAQARVIGREMDYKAGDTVLKGYLAYDTAFKGPRPGVLVVHEWWGNNDYSHRRARQLARLGYTAFALDMYGEGRHADTTDQAGKLSGEVMGNMVVAKARFDAALAVLRAQETVDPSDVGAIGYCFGGGIVLNMARMGEDLKGVVSFHGNLSAKVMAQPGQIKTQILVCQGGADAYSPPAQLQVFKKEMADAGANLQVIVYPGAQHAFTNPAATGLGKKFKIAIAYDKEADVKSWSDMRRFLKITLGR